VRFQRASSSEIITLDEQALLGAGGEARIYVPPNNPELVAKIWHKPTLERTRKLRVMVANPPLNPTAGQSHDAIAWPLDLLYPPGRADLLAGFLMPRVTGMRPVGEFYNPKTRREQCPLFNYFYLHRTARNLAIAVRALHERGYVIGDVNESNLLVSETALVTLVDTDSFQVWDAETGQMYRCRVGKPEFTPPELQGKSFSQVDRGPEHDLFGLGVLIFQLLLEGTHPFAGVFKGRGEPPPIEQRIAAGLFPHGTDPNLPFAPKPTAPLFETIAPGLRDLFVRCFQDGHFRPGLRPDPQSWQFLLEEAESHLVSCWWNSQHVYGDHLDQCPWCARAALLGGRDPFPSVDAVKAGRHLRPAKPPPGRVFANPLPATQQATVLTPAPIPPSRGSTLRRRRPLLGDWNDWAWIAGTLAAMTIASAWPFHWQANLVTFLLGLLTLLAGILGEYKSHKPDLDGELAWLARVSIVIGLAGVLWSVYSHA
jgi:DNA-binding helix-hairpin-helix protein with protein kinase domain